MRLFHKLLIVFLAAALGPLLLAGTWLARETERSLRSSSLHLQRGQAERTAAHVQGYIEEVYTALLLAHKSPGFLPLRPEGLRPVFETLLSHHPMLMDLAAFDADGRQVFIFNRFARSGPFFSDWPAVRETMGRSGRFLGEYAVEKGIYPMLKVAVPVDGGGCVAARVNLLDLRARLGGLVDEEGGEIATLLDGEGRPVLSSSPEDALGARFRAPPAATGEYEDGRGRRVLGVSAPVPELGWTLAYERPAARAFELAARVRRGLARSLLAAVLAAVLLGVLVSRFLSRRIEEIRFAVQRMKEGRFDAALSAGAKDEIGALARAFLEAQTSLEKKVRQSVIGLMSHRIGHDLRTPLTAIRNSLEVIRRHVSGADAVAERHFGLIEDEIRRGTDYVEEILTFGRERPPRLQSINLNNWVRDSLRQFPLEKGVEVDLAQADPSPVCGVDENELRRALFNVLANAQEAMRGSGRIDVSVENRDAFAVLRVRDHGPGMPEDVKERAFEEFFSTKPEGTGLGLGIVKKIVERHGGDVRLESALRTGTSVEIRLPLAKEAPPHA